MRDDDLRPFYDHRDCLLCHHPEPVALDLPMPERRRRAGYLQQAHEARAALAATRVGNLMPGDVRLYRGGRVTIVAIDSMPTPGGGTVPAILIERPRAGRKWVMPGELRELTDDVPKARQTTEAEGSFGPRHP